MLGMTGLSALMLAVVLVNVTHCSPLADQYDERQPMTSKGRQEATVPNYEITSNSQNPKKQRDDPRTILSNKPLSRQQRDVRNYQSSGYYWAPPNQYQVGPPASTYWRPSGFASSFLNSAARPVRYSTYDVSAQPQQPINVRPFFRPRNGYLPPRGYLPPDPKQKPMSIDYNDDDNEDTTIPLIVRAPGLFDDAPVWDVVPNLNRPSTTARPTVPTRRRPNVQTTLPSLVHGSGNNTQISNSGAFRPPQQDTGIVLNLSPPFATTTTTTSRPSRPVPSRCIWAIISCCSATSSDINYGCFEQMGCIGAFWDSSPCDSDFARAAINVVTQYYGSRK